MPHVTNSFSPLLIGGDVVTGNNSSGQCRYSGAFSPLLIGGDVVTICAGDGWIQYF